ncbi:Vitamin B12 ABC transporter, substrate-binding protein BtuF [hydrothermal vent metagenome]|uniref:Vitamin B12 ABC transporter, substrate-binding protein BtuF n=1 Tax=hydrothermal vent metagenome TaxID=652676 RepID=A0A3B0YBV7_9ZZZZ
MKTIIKSIIHGCFLVFFVTGLVVQASIYAVDDKGTEFEFAQPVKRIISLAPHATELLFAAGATDQIVGTVSYSDYPEAAKKIPLIGGYNKVDIERIMSKKPELIVAWSSGNSTEQIEKLRHLGFRVFISEPEKFTDVARSIRNMGRFLGTEKIAQAVSSRFLSELKALKHEYPRKEKVRVFYQVWNAPLMTLSDKHLVGQVIEFCSGENVFGDLDIISPRVSIEAVIEKNPDVIIAGMTKDRRGWLKEWEKWRVLKAVANQHVYPIDAELVVRQTPRILQGTRKMCEYLDIVRKTHR